MRSVAYSTLCFMFIAGLLSGCSGSESVPIVPSSGPTSGPAASADDQRASQSDALTSDEASLVSQANAEAAPPQKQDL
jgi:hypothetical protein